MHGREAFDSHYQRLFKPTVFEGQRYELLEQRDGNCRLTPSFAARLSETAPIWGRAVAPIAEWVAQALWSSSRRAANKKDHVPTRLTQRRRSEARGNKFAAKAMMAPRGPKICEVCGAEDVTNRYCRSCAVEVSRESMSRVALIGHSKPKTSKAMRCSL